MKTVTETQLLEWKEKLAQQEKYLQDELQATRGAQIMVEELLKQAAEQPESEV